MTVVAFIRPESPLPMPPTRESASERRLKSSAKILSTLFFVLFVSCITLVMSGVTSLLLRTNVVIIAGTLDHQLGFSLPLDFASGLDDDAVKHHFISILHYPVWVSVLASFLTLIRFTPGLMVLWFLFRLFRLYSEGMIFTEQNTRQIRYVAYSVLLYSGVRVVTYPSMYVIGMTRHVFSFEMQQVDAFVLGLILLAVAHVMAIGNTIQQEREDYL